MKQKLLLFSLLVVLVSCSKQESMDEMIDLSLIHISEPTRH